MSANVKSLLFSGVMLILGVQIQAQAPTWSKDIAPILYKNCTGCHHAGALAPNPLMTYAETFNYRYQITQYVNDNTMPPWPPDPTYKRLAHERVLSQGD